MNAVPPRTSVVSPAIEAGSAEWWAGWSERTARRRPRAHGLSIDLLITSALALIDDEGLEAVTMRRLAEVLGTASASLYRHVASRDELLVLLVDHVLGDIVLPSDELPGRARTEWLAAELRRVLLAHVNLLPALAASPLVGPNALRGAANGFANLLHDGFDEHIAAVAYLAIIDYVLGTVFFDTSRASRSSPDRIGPFGGVADDGVPRPSADEVFTFGVAMFLDGLDAHR